MLISDATGEWIANFPSRHRDGRFDVVGLEAVGLDLAAAAGITVPDHRLLRLGKSGRRRCWYVGCTRQSTDGCSRVSSAKLSCICVP